MRAKTASQERATAIVQNVERWRARLQAGTIGYVGLEIALANSLRACDTLSQLQDCWQATVRATKGENLLAMRLYLTSVKDTQKARLGVTQNG